MSFDKAFNYTIKYEGGYANDPNDYGGETFAGISRVYWPRWSGWPKIDAAKRKPNFPKSLYTDPAIQDSVKEFYRMNFWDKVKGDDLDKYDEEISAEVFDCSVNMGTGRGAKFLQVALNIFNRNGALYSELIVDGAIGPSTLSAYRTFFRNDRGDVLLKALLIERGAFYGNRALDDSSQERFIRGWLNRLNINKV